MSEKIKITGYNFIMALVAIFVYEFTSDLFAGITYIFFPAEIVESHDLMIDTLLVTVLLVIFSIWLYRIYQNSHASGLSLKNKFDKRMLYMVPILTLGVNGISGLWFVAVDKGIKSLPLFAESMDSFTDTCAMIESQPYLWSFLSVVLIGPIVEELLFRGLVFHYLEKIKTGCFAIIISGIAFGLWHQEPVQCVYTAIMGVILGLVYAKVRDLKIVIAIHMLNNLLSTLPPVLDTQIVNIVINYVSFLMILPALIILIRMARERSKTCAV